MKAASLKPVDVADRLALVISGACLVHCLAVPLLFALLPALTTVLDMPEALHLWLVVTAVPVSGYALVAGRNRNGPYLALVLGAVGLLLLMVGVLVVTEALEIVATVGGGLLLGGAHITNWRRRHAAQSTSVS